METRDRVKWVRKQHLGMSQTAFAEELGVSRSVIKNIENDYLRRPDTKLPIIKLIAKMYNISENWLLTGEGSPDAAPDEFSLDLFAKQNGATELELDAMKAYFSVDENTSRMFMEQFYNYLTVYEEARAKEATSKVLEAHAELQHELTAQAKAAEKSTGSGSLPA